MTDVVIMAYRAKPGHESELPELVHAYVPTLVRLGLATDRPPVALSAEDGAIILVFEWHEGALARAHEIPEVVALWERHAAISSYVPLSTLSETQGEFARFSPLS